MNQRGQKRFKLKQPEVELLKINSLVATTFNHVALLQDIEAALAKHCGRDWHYKFTVEG